MASLRQRRLAGDVALNWLYQDRYLGWLALVFASDRPEEVDRQITHWLQALQQTTPEQQQHYYQLSAAAFRRCRLSISCASGHSLPRRAARRVRRFCAALQAPVGQPGLSNRFPMGACCHRALACRSRWRRRPESDPALAFAFYPQAAGDLVAKCRRKPRRCSISRYRKSRRGSCCDRPSTARPIRPKDWRVEQLRPLLAALRHAGDTASGICSTAAGS